MSNVSVGQSELSDISGPVGVILAGGASRRMGGHDKGALLLNGRRLVDHVYERLSGQVVEVLVAGGHNYELPCAMVPDRAEGPAGPVAGIYAVWQWLNVQRPALLGFYTVPVDGPFVPGDLVKRLGTEARCVVAYDGLGCHPTFAWWPMAALAQVWRGLVGQRSVSLRQLAEACGARGPEGERHWPGETSFLNLNTPEDFERADALFSCEN